ncbi:MAG: hypothetical protein V1841_01210, partial [Patescibacteria group bacterium]
MRNINEETKVKVVTAYVYLRRGGKKHNSALLEISLRTGQAVKFIKNIIEEILPPFLLKVLPNRNLNIHEKKLADYYLQTRCWYGCSHRTAIAR